MKNRIKISNVRAFKLYTSIAPHGPSLKKCVVGVTILYLHLIG